MRISKLRSIVKKEVAQINSIRYRCHEVARVLTEKLSSMGLEAKVADGLAFYDINELKAKYFHSCFGVAVEKKDEGVLCAVHSWCEVYIRGEVVIIDCNRILRISENLIFEHYLSVDYKENIPHKYCNRSINLGKFIIIFCPKSLRRLPRIIRLRV